MEGFERKMKLNDCNSSNYNNKVGLCISVNTHFIPILDIAEIHPTPHTPPHLPPHTHIKLFSFKKIFIMNQRIIADATFHNGKHIMYLFFYKTPPDLLHSFSLHVNQTEIMAQGS